MNIKFLNKRSSFYTLCIFSLVFVVGFIYPGSASALTISPARIEIDGDPGTTVNRPITLFNDNKTNAQTFYVSFANFEAQGETGSPNFVDPKNDLGTWMSVDSEIITIPAGGSMDLTLSIDIPTDAFAGGHFAAVFFGNAPKDGGQVSVGAKTGLLVLLSVNGDVLGSGGIANFSTKNKKRFYNSLPVTFQYRFKNDGNDRVKPEGNIVIRNMLYIPTERINANTVSGNVLPNSTRLFSTDWIEQPEDKDALPPKNIFGKFFNRVSYQWNNFALGPYFAVLDVVHGSQNIRTTKHTFFFVFPWQLVLCMLLVLSIVYFVGRKLLRRYNAKIIKRAQAGMYISR